VCRSSAYFDYFFEFLQLSGYYLLICGNVEILGIIIEVENHTIFFSQKVWYSRTCALYFVEMHGKRLKPNREQRTSRRVQISD
jgi:hypothetical protein